MCNSSIHIKSNLCCICYVLRINLFNIGGGHQIISNTFKEINNDIPIEHVNGKVH